MNYITSGGLYPIYGGWGDLLNRDIAVTERKVINAERDEYTSLVYQTQTVPVC